MDKSTSPAIATARASHRRKGNSPFSPAAKCAGNKVPAAITRHLSCPASPSSAGPVSTSTPSTAPSWKSITSGFFSAPDDSEQRAALVPSKLLTRSEPDRNPGSWKPANPHERPQFTTTEESHHPPHSGDQTVRNFQGIMRIHPFTRAPRHGIITGYLRRITRPRYRLR